jgi:hypothetical protein
MGVDVVESKTTHLEKYTNLITVEFCAAEKALSVSGTVFGKDSEILVDSSVIIWISSFQVMYWHCRMTMCRNHRTCWYHSRS